MKIFSRLIPEIILLLIVVGCSHEHSTVLRHGSIQTNDDFTAMMVACRNGQRETAELLRAEGPTVNAKVNKGATILNALFLMEASEHGHKDIVEVLLATGADVNSKDWFGGTALIAASRKGCKDIVEFLLYMGADVNAKDCVTSSMVVNGVPPKPHCHTALSLASQYGHREIVDLLRAAGAKE